LPFIFAVLFLLINISFTFDVTSAGGKQFVLWVQNSVTWPRPCPLWVCFMIRTQ